MNDVVTERVELAVAEEGGMSPMAAHLARPAAQGPFPGVVVAMEMFGVTAYIRDVTERAGARDRGGQEPGTSDGGAPAAGRVAMLGCSLGGHLAYLAATRFELAAAAVFYGGWLTTTDIPLSRPEPTIELTPGIAARRGRVLYLVGDGDHAVPPDARARIESALRLADVRHEMVVYPDTPHGFFCDVRDTYRDPQAQDAWRRVRSLFAEELGAATRIREP